MKTAAKDLNFSGDITLQSTCESVVYHTIEKFGRIDILVNNAGFYSFESVRNAPIEHFERIMDVNLKSAVVMTKLCLPHLEKTRGNIVNNSSVVSLKSYSNTAYYNMSKVRAFTDCLVHLYLKLFLRIIWTKIRRKQRNNFLD